MVDANGDIEVGTAEQWYTVGGLLASTMFMYFLLARCLKLGQLMSFDVLEQQRDLSTVKDTVRNIWTNVALVGALLLTISCPLILDSQMAGWFKTNPALACAYQTLTILSTLQFAGVTLECIVHLIYTEALTSSGTTRYLIQARTSIGGPMLLFMLALVNLVAAVGIHVILAYGIASFSAGLAASFITLFVLLSVLFPASYFSPFQEDPGASGWVWVERLEDSHADSPHRPWWDRLLHGSYSKGQLKTLQKRAHAAKLLEEKQSDGENQAEEGVIKRVPTLSSQPHPQGHLKCDPVA